MDKRMFKRLRIAAWRHEFTRLRNAADRPLTGAIPDLRYYAYANRENLIQTAFHLRS